jgi:hypothetical protein
MSQERTEQGAVQSVELVIEPQGGGADAITISGRGLPPDLGRSPERIHQLLDLLEMPKGTKVTINVQASSSVVR